MRLVTDTIEFGTRELPRWNTVSISGYHIREAGSTAVQELAFTIADGMAYVEAALARGLRVDDFAPRLSFFFNSHSDFFEEIAKFRASRRIWYKLMTERYRRRERALDLDALPHPDRRRLADAAAAAQQPDPGRDPGAGRGPRRHAVAPHRRLRRGARRSRPPRPPCSPSASSRSSPRRPASTRHGRPARRLVVRRGADRTRPSAQVWRYLDEIDRRGGMVAAIAEGYPQREIADAAYRFQREFDAGERRIVGVNAYVDAAEATRDPGPGGARRARSERHLAAAGADAARARRRRPSRRRCAGCARRPRRPGLERDEPDAALHPLRRGLRDARRAVRASCARSSASTASRSAV